jgi:hypothetical protein
MIYNLEQSRGNYMLALVAWNMFSYSLLDVSESIYMHCRKGQNYSLLDVSRAIYICSRKGLNMIDLIWYNLSRLEAIF